MDFTHSFVHFNAPYVLICGSYQDNRVIDKLCTILGNELAKQNIGLISGGGRPAIKIAESMDKTLTDMGYDEPFKIVTIYRKKRKEDDLKTKRIGCNLFVEKDIHDIRDYLFSKSKVSIVIGGATKTKQEILLAHERKISIVPVAMSGGAAFSIWEQYLRYGRRHINKDLFSQLNNKNPFIASNAVIDISKELIRHDGKDTGHVNTTGVQNPLTVH